MSIGERLNELLTEDKTMIPVNIGIGPEGFFNINKSVVYSWGIMLVFLILCIFLTSNMRIHNISKRQLIAETIVVKLRGLVADLLGTFGSRYTEYILTVLLYIALSNLVGVVGLVPPTMDLNVTVGLALMSIVLIEAASISKNGAGGWLKSFTKPIWIVTPMNILELAIRPLSLCMRLFGNVLGATVIMELIKMAVPMFIPALASLYFDFFDGLIQAYVFIFLTSLYIKEATE
jgi:F-type H+-transporting ATPase subunit a